MNEFIIRPTMYIKCIKKFLVTLYVFGEPFHSFCRETPFFISASKYFLGPRLGHQTPSRCFLLFFPTRICPTAVCKARATREVHKVSSSRLSVSNSQAGGVVIATPCPTVTIQCWTLLQDCNLHVFPVL